MTRAGGGVDTSPPAPGLRLLGRGAADGAVAGAGDAVAGVDGSFAQIRARSPRGSLEKPGVRGPQVLLLQ